MILVTAVLFLKRWGKLSYVKTLTALPGWSNGST